MCQCPLVLEKVHRCRHFFLAPRHAIAARDEPYNTLEDTEKRLRKLLDTRKGGL